MATSLRSHVTYLPAILLVLCFCLGITLGQNGAVAASGINSTIVEENQNSSVATQPDSNQAPPGPSAIATDPTTTPTTTVQTTPSTTTVSSTTPSTTMTSTTPLTTMSSTTPSTTMPSTTPSTTMSSTTPSATMTSTTPSTTMSSTMPSTTMSSTTPSTTMPSTTPSTNMTSTTPSTTMTSTTPSTTMSSTTPSTTMPSTTPLTTMSSTTPSTTMTSTTPLTTMTSTTPSTTMSSTTPSTTRSSTTPSTTISSTTPLSTQDPTAATSAGTPIAGGIGGGATISPAVPKGELETTSMKPMSTDTITRPPQEYSSAAPVTVGTPRAVNDTTVVMRTTRPIIRQTSAPVIGSLPPFIPTTKYRDTGAQRTTKGPVLPGQPTTAYRPVSTDTDGVTTGRMTPPQTPKMTTKLRQTTAKVLPVRTSPLRTTSKPVSTTGFDHGREQTGPDITTPRVKATTVGPVMSTTPPRVSTTMVTQVTKMTTTIPPAPTTETPEMPKDVTYSIRFEGDCNIIKSDSNVREKFEIKFIEMYSGKLGVPKNNILIQDISCGSVQVLCTLIGIHQSKVEKSLDEAVAQPAPLIVNADGQIYAYRPVSYTLADPPGPSQGVPAPGGPPSDPTILAPAPPSKLRDVDMIIIIVVSIIGGLLIIIIIALIIHECRRRSHTKSFDLRGTPRPHIHTEDFTLTKMERGPAEYNDYGLVVNPTSNGHTRTPQVGVATIVETPNHQNGGAMHNGYHKAAKEEYGPEYDAGPDSPSISLMKSMRTPEVEGGIENPSFSSEDILDSGTETDKELVSSDKGLDSPYHAPLQVYPAAESDSGRQSDSLTELPTDTPPQHSPRSNLSDNTGSDHTYEPFEGPTTPDIPQSPTSHEVLMPIEEVGYPSEATEEPSSAPQSPTPPDEMSHNPEHGSYEMMETRSPGKRESDFFAPSEGATAF